MSDELRTLFMVGLLAVGAHTCPASDRDGDGVDDTIDVCCETPLGIVVDAQGRPLGDLDGDCDVDQSDYGIMQANFTGAKPPGEGLCPSECAESTDCSTAEYCAMTPGQCGGVGVCEPIPLTCPDVWNPVCGCDGLTYGNECEAAQDGTTVDYPGNCIGWQGCLTNQDCAFASYCKKTDGQCEGFGHCAEVPENCALIVDPVCGCDGHTYSNACFAAKARVNVDYPGQCQ